MFLHVELDIEELSILSIYSTNPYTVTQNISKILSFNIISKRVRLSDCQKIEVKRLHSEEQCSQKELSSKYSVNQTTISRILSESIEKTIHKSKFNDLEEARLV